MKLAIQKTSSAPAIHGEGIELTNWLLILCGIYTLAAANEYWLLNWLKSDFNISLAIFAALLQNFSWPVQLIFYRRERELLPEPRVITPAMYKSYFILGTLSALITITRTMGIVNLPATIYAIVANTEIVFETIMTKVVLGRSISKLQILAVSLVICGVMISLYDPTTNQYGENDNVSQGTLISGVVLSLCSRLASSLNTILADR